MFQIIQTGIEERLRRVYHVNGWSGDSELVAASSQDSV
jgi:hypothetical protein